MTDREQTRRDAPPSYMAFVGYFGGAMTCVGIGIGFVLGWWLT